MFEAKGEKQMAGGRSALHFLGLAAYVKNRLFLRISLSDIYQTLLQELMMCCHYRLGNRLNDDTRHRDALSGYVSSG